VRSFSVAALLVIWPGVDEADGGAGGLGRHQRKVHRRGAVGTGRPGRRSVAVFVSYPWGDQATESWVRDRLVPDLGHAGVEIVLDRASSRVSDSLARFVERVQTADRVLVIATPAYAEKYENAAGTVVAAEADVINLRLLGTEEQKSTVLPVLLAGDPAESLPALMQTRIYADFRNRTGTSSSSSTWCSRCTIYHPASPP
jgi:TIR domain